MIRTKINYRWILVILWMSLIFILSHQDASRSSQLSGGMMMAVIDFMTGIFRNFNVDAQLLHFLIRKGAHFSAYLILGLLAAHASEPEKRKEWLWTLILCIVYAASDEYHQSFIPGRSGELRDVLIDSAGSLTGILFYRALLSLRNRRHKGIKNMAA